MNEAATLVAAIDENRRNIRAARLMVRESRRQPALWIDAGQKAVRTYSMVRLAAVATSGLLRIIGLKFLLRTSIKTLPLAAVGWGAYRLMRR